MLRQNVGENVALGKILLWNVMYTAKFAGKFQQLVTSPKFFSTDADFTVEFLFLFFITIMNRVGQKGK